MRSITLCGITAAAMLLSSTPAASADLIILSANRSVSTGYTYLPSGMFTPIDVSESDTRVGIGLADLDAALDDPGTFDGFATQTSSVTSASFMGSFTGAFDALDPISELGTPTGAHANANLVVFFQLTEATTFSLSFSSAVTGDTTASTFQGLVVSSEHTYELGRPDVTEVLTLDPGSYIFQMNVEHTTDGLGAGSFSSVFSFNVIPAPGGLALLGLGLIGRPRRRRG